MGVRDSSPQEATDLCEALAEHPITAGEIQAITNQTVGQHAAVQEALVALQGITVSSGAELKTLLDHFKANGGEPPEGESAVPVRTRRRRPRRTRRRRYMLHY
jgi:hypothetical protein